MELGKKRCETDRQTLDQKFIEFETINGTTRKMNELDQANGGSILAAIDSGSFRMEEAKGMRTFDVDMNTLIKKMKKHLIWGA